MSMNPPANDHSPAPHPDEDGDEREFECFAQEQDPLDLAAASWVSRKRNGLDAQGQAELQAWLDADPRHGEAFEDMADTFGELQQLPHSNVTSLRNSLPQISRPPKKTRPGRQSWAFNLALLLPRMGTAAFAIAVVGGGTLGWSHWRQLPTFEQTYATTRGQQLSITLPDAGPQGSRLQLDTVTRAEVRLYRQRREVHLKDGQAMLTVAKDASRPFQVWAGPLRITVTGTRFSVRHTASGLEAGQTVVSVEEGHVRVEHRQSAREADASGETAKGAPIVLTAGQKVVADGSGHIGQVQQVSAMAIATWRDGRISFEQTPLAQALAEFERYGHTGLVVRDPTVAALPIGGSYKLQHLGPFAEALPQMLPVRLVPRGKLTEIVAR